MSIRALKRLVPFLVPLLVLIFIVLRFYNERLIAWPFQGGLWTGNVFSVDTKSQRPKHLQDSLSTTTPNDDSGAIEQGMAEIISNAPSPTTSTLRPSGQIQSLPEHSIYS